MPWRSCRYALGSRVLRVLDTERAEWRGGVHVSTPSSRAPVGLG